MIDADMWSYRQCDVIIQLDRRNRCLIMNTILWYTFYYYASHFFENAKFVATQEFLSSTDMTFDFITVSIFFFFF